MKPKFEADQTYTTRDGRKAKVYEVYEDFIHGAVLYTSNTWCMVQWETTGYYERQGTGLDLMPPKPEPREWKAVVDRRTNRLYWADAWYVASDVYEVITVREVIEE